MSTISSKALMAFEMESHLGLLKILSKQVVVLTYNVLAFG